MNAPRLEPYATLDAAGIPRRVLGERFAAVCERLEDTAPAWATESDIYRKAGFYLDDRGTLEWEDGDVCELDPDAIKRADGGELPLSVFDAINAVFALPRMPIEPPAPREWYAVLDRDGFGDVYPDKATAERDAATYNERIREYAPYRVAHLREVA